MRNIFKILVVALTALSGCQSDNSSNIGPRSGQGGSMARFAIAGNSLYIVDDQSLKYLDITEGGNPKKGGSIDLGFGIETVFPYEKKLFVGASDGMYIFDNMNPMEPKLLTKYWHIQSCDPVVVQDQVAYVTLRSGTECRTGASLSSLDVIDISNIAAPKLVQTQTLSSPYGLGVSGKHLFVCEGDNGLRVFNLENPQNPVQVKSYSEYAAYDVIIRNANSLILTGKKGLFQFSFGEEPGNLTLLSQIPVR